MTQDDPTDFPDWPQTSVPPTSAKADILQVFGTATREPDPQDVIKFKKDNNASVAETALRFGLSRAQIVKVCVPG